MLNIHLSARAGGMRGVGGGARIVSPSKKKKKSEKKGETRGKKIHLSYLSEHLPSLTGPSSSRVTGTLGDICPNR